MQKVLKTVKEVRDSQGGQVLRNAMGVSNFQNKSVTKVYGVRFNITDRLHACLRSSCNGILLLKVTVPRKTIGQSSFAVAGPQMWNDLPIDVRSAQSFISFRKHLKTCLFRRHYLA